MITGVETGTDKGFPLAVAFVDKEYVMCGRSFPAFIKDGVDMLRVTVKYRTANNDQWHQMPEAIVDATDAAGYLAHMAKVVMAANGVHNGQHNKLLPA